MQFNLILEKIKFYKKSIIAISSLLVLISLIIFWYFFYFTWSMKVLAWNFDFNYRKIPFDVWYIDFTLSSDLDETTVNKTNFEINPKIDWVVTLVNKNTIRYKFLEKLTVWQDMSITLKSWLKSSLWKNLDKEYNYIVSIIESPKVLKITPSWKLNNLGQNIAVFFNIPMVPLTNLDTKDKLPCPIVIEPKIEWKCRWTTSSVMEFIPKNWFVWATKYKITVNNDNWLLYKLWQSWTWTIETPNLMYWIDNTFHVDDWIKIRFNFTPELESLKKLLSVVENPIYWNTVSEAAWDINSNTKSVDQYENITKKDSITVSTVNPTISNTKEVAISKWVTIMQSITTLVWWNKKDFTLEYEQWNDWIVIIKINWWYKFDKTYSLSFLSWIKSKYGNVPTDKPYEKSIHSYSFLNSYERYQNIFSWSEIVNTKNFTYNSDYNNNWNEDYSPSKNLFFKLNFEQDINILDKTLFSFESDWKKIDFDLSYDKLEDENKKIIDNKRVLKLTLKQNLLQWKTYKLIIKKDINLSLEKDIIEEIKTAPALEVKKLSFLSYSKSCLYTNNRLLDNFWENANYIVKTIPSSKINSINEIYWSDYDKENPCPTQDSWFWYIVNTRLNPNTNYKLTISNLTEDKYWNSLWNPFSIKAKTWDIKDWDKYLYVSLSKEINLIPKSLPIILNLQTVNEDNVTIDVCEMDKNWYIDYWNNRWNHWFTPKCISNISKKLQTKNNYWNLTNNKFDLEKDIFWWKSNANILLIRWYNSVWLLSFSNIFLRSDLNMTYESWSNKKLLFISDFSWNKVEWLDLEFLSYNYEKKQVEKENPKYIFNKKTGIFELEDSSFNYIISSNDKFFGILDLNYNSFSDYDFKYVWWNPTYDKNYLYLYTERPIYKPGDSVYFKWLLRDFQFNWYKKSETKSWKLEVLDSSFTPIYSTQILVDKNSNFNWSFIIPKDVKLGEFIFRFTWWDGYTFYKNDAKFYIEEYRKPDFKIDVENISNNYLLWEKASMTISPQYYFGWNMTSTTWQYTVLTQNYFFDAKDYSDYQFWEWYKYFDCVYWGYCEYSDYLSEYKSFTVDENWKAIINYSFPTKEDLWEKIVSFNVEIKDKDTSKVVNKTVSTVLHNTDSYVWLKVPYWNDWKKLLKWSFVLLDYDAKPVVSKNVKIELIKRDWKMVKKQWVDWVFYDDYSMEEKLESSSSLVSSTLWTQDFSFTPKSSWEYMIKATYTWVNWKSFISSSNVYVSWDDYTLWNNWNNDTTDIIAEKNQLLVWEKAYYTLKSPVNNWKALIIVEKDDWILDYFVHDIKSFWDRLEIDIKDTYYPNYYVRAFLIWKENWNTLPVYKRALIATKVSTEYKKLNITVSPSKKVYKPWENVLIEITVKDAKWQIVPFANWSVSMVDESLLALVWNPIKNPYAFFYDMKRYLGTFMASTMVNLIEKLEIKDLSNWEKWGAWEQIKWWDSKKKRWVFKDTAFWQSDFTTDKEWKAYIKTTSLPDNLTTWVIETLVNTPDDNKIGVNYSSITTAQEIIITDNLPNFMSVWDKVTLSPVIFNKTWKDSTFDVSITTTNLKIIGQTTKKVWIKNNESKTVNFDISVLERSSFTNMQTAYAEVSFTANEIGTNRQDSIEKMLQVKDSSIKESVSTIWQTKDKSFDEIIDLYWLKEKIWQVKLSYSATLFTSLLDSIDYLSNYPYWCSEQKTSSIMPNVYIKSLYNSTWDKFDLSTKMVKYFDDDTRKFKEKSIDQILKEYLVDIRKYQKDDWWFVYWYDIDSFYPNYSNFHLSSYILNSMAELNRIWYKQDEKVTLNLVSYLKKRFYENKIEWCIITKYDNCRYSERERLESLEAIQNYDSSDYEANKMYKLLKLENLDVSTKIRESIVLANLANINLVSNENKIKDNAKDTINNIVVWENEKYKIKAKDILNEIINNDLVFNPRGAYIGKTDWYSRIINTSLLLRAISVIWEKEFSDSSNIIDNSIRWIIWQKKNWSFWSTQDNMAVIISISKYLSNTNALKDLNFSSTVSLNWNKVDEKLFNFNNKFETVSKSLNLNSLKNKNTLNFTKSWNWTLYYDLSMDYFLTWKNIQARDEWFVVIKEYYDFNEYKKINDLKKKEWNNYNLWKISYNNIKYKKSIFEYITQVSYPKVWELVIVRNRIITPETRDKVAFESFIPAWSELINPNLATSSKKAFEISDDYYNYDWFTSNNSNSDYNPEKKINDDYSSSSNIIGNYWNAFNFERIEYRSDRLFWYTSTMYSWIYDSFYLIRYTHAWEYYVKPTQISEFYNSEVFGRSSGEVIVIK